MEEYKDYTVYDLYLDPVNSPTKMYYELKPKEKINLHWGQRKLLLVLLQFLNIFWDPVKVPIPKIVYAGAAPGINIPIVSMLYPEVEFHLYDPSPFKIKPTDKIKIYQEFFTDDVAKKWADRSDVYFISDIRTITLKKGINLDKHEKVIVDNMNMQMQWYNIIKPVFGQLKFRLPFTGGNRPPKINYLYGYIFKQPWAPEISIETRLVPLPNHGLVVWDTKTYQNQMFYHNTEVRSKIKYYNPFGPGQNNTTPIDGLELLNDWDSTTEAMIIASYLKKRTGTYTTEQVNSISRLLTSKINEGLKYKISLETRRAQGTQKTRDNYKAGDRRGNYQRSGDKRSNQRSGDKRDYQPNQSNRGGGKVDNYKWGTKK